MRWHHWTEQDPIVAIRLEILLLPVLADHPVHSPEILRETDVGDEPRHYVPGHCQQNIFLRCAEWDRFENNQLTWQPVDPTPKIKSSFWNLRQMETFLGHKLVGLCWERPQLLQSGPVLLLLLAGTLALLYLRDCITVSRRIKTMALKRSDGWNLLNLLVQWCIGALKVIKCHLYITKVLSFNLFPLIFGSTRSHLHPHLLRSTNSTISQSSPLAAVLEAVGLVLELTGVHS